MLSVWIIKFIEFDGRILFDGTVQIPKFVIYIDGKYFTGQAVAQAPGYIQSRHTLLKLPYRSVGKCDVDH